MLIFLFCCIGLDDDETWPAEMEPFKPLERFNLRTVQTCAVLSERSTVFPERLVFLYKLDGKGVDAQAELIGVTTTRLRCGEVHLALKPEKDGTEVTMNFMPPVVPPIIDELRVYAPDPVWSEENPYAIAREKHEPWSDYVFNVNQVMPAFNDTATIFVGEK